MPQKLCADSWRAIKKGFWIENWRLRECYFKKIYLCWGFGPYARIVWYLFSHYPSYRCLSNNCRFQIPIPKCLQFYLTTSGIYFSEIYYKINAPISPYTLLCEQYWLHPHQFLQKIIINRNPKIILNPLN